MKNFKILFYFCFISVLTLLSCKSPPEPYSTIESYKYFIMLPKDYEYQEKCPLILFLHGAGYGTTDIEIFKMYGLGFYADRVKDFPFIIVAPQSVNEWIPEIVDNLINEISEEYHVDLDRIYVTGFNQGGYATFFLACTYPDRFAALAPISGWGRPEDAWLIRDVPVWIFHNSGDPEIPVDNSQLMYDALQAVGADVTLTIYENETHNAWNSAYKDPELYAWFLTYRRNGE